MSRPSTAMGPQGGNQQASHTQNGGSGQRRGTREVLNGWRAELGVGTGLVLLCVLCAAVAPNFTAGANISLLLQQLSVVMIVAAGQTFVILTGEIDLSVGSAVGLSTVLLATLTVEHTLPWPLAVVAVFGVGLLIGMFTGALRVVWGIPSFIITLGLLTALQGVAFTISDGVTIAPTPAALSPLWEGRLLGVATPIWVMAGVVALATWVLTQTTYGRHLYALGGNAEAARRYGVNTSALRISVFVVVQGAAVLGGLLYTAQLGSGNATVGRMMELNVIAAVVVGGVALFGGQGRLVGTVLGVLFISVLANGLTLMGVSAYVFLIAQGFVVIAAVWFGAVQKQSAAQRCR